MNSSFQSKNARRLLIVGLDMGDGPLLRHWSRLGHLPHFSQLIRSGLWLDLETTARVLHTSAWPTFATGSLPGRHGVYYPYQPKPGYQLAPHIEPDQYGTPTMWQIAADQGARCLVYDIPETFPDLRFRGKGIYDWGTWAWYGTPASQPAGIIKELKSKFGNYPLGMEAKRLGLRSPDRRHMAQGLKKSVEYKVKSLGWLLEQEEWDLAAVGFCEPHPAGHYLWPEGAESIEQGDERAFEPLLQVYQALDQGIGDIRRIIGTDTALMVVSGDGVQVNRCGWHLLAPMLEKLGYTGSNLRSNGDGGQPAGRLSMLGRARRMLPKGTKRWIADHLPWWLRDRLGSQASASEIDWSRTRAFTLPTDLEGCIRINLKGREPEGIVEPGSEYQELCEKIREDLRTLVNPASGEAAVREVWVRNEVFPGERQEHLPDIVATWNPQAPFDALLSPRVGEVLGSTPDPRTGTHSPEGFLLTVGPNVASDSRGSARLVDVAPTALHFLGLAAGKAMDGSVISLQTPTTGVATN